MEKLATPSRRFYWPRAIGTVMAFEARKLWWVVLPALGMAVMWFFLGSGTYSADFILMNFGQDFGEGDWEASAAYFSIWVAWNVGFGGYWLDLQRGFSLMLAAPGAATLGRFGLSLALGLGFPVAVFLGGTVQLTSAGLPVAWGVSLGFLLFGLLLLWLPLMALIYLLGLLGNRSGWFALSGFLIFFMSSGHDRLMTSMAERLGPPGPDFPALFGYLLRWPLPLPEAVMPGSAHAQVVVFPGIPWGWTLVGLGLTALFLLASLRVTASLEFSVATQRVRGSSAANQSELEPVVWQVPELKPVSAWDSLVVVAKKESLLLRVGAIFGVVFAAITPLLTGLPGDLLWIWAAVWLLMVAFGKVLIGYQGHIWPPQTAPGIPPGSPTIAVSAHGLFIALYSWLAVLGVLLGLVVVFTIVNSAAVAISDLLVVFLYSLGVFAVPLTGWALLLGAWRGAARSAPAWLVLIIGVATFLTAEAAIWWQSWTFLPAWPLLGPELIGISSAGLYSLPQEPFWLSLLVGIGAFFLAARVYEEVEV
jgi:hypothetical protein